MEKTSSIIETIEAETFSMDYIRFGQGSKILVILPGLSVQSVTKKTLIMGILNVTPDSFSDGGRYCECFYKVGAFGNSSFRCIAGRNDRTDYCGCLP